MQVTEFGKERLTSFFGKGAADIILRHMNDLENIFGSAAPVIGMIMEGKTRMRPSLE